MRYSAASILRRASNATLSKTGVHQFFLFIKQASVLHYESLSEKKKNNSAFTGLRLGTS